MQRLISELAGAARLGRCPNPWRSLADSPIRLQVPRGRPLNSPLTLWGARRRTLLLGTRSPRWVLWPIGGRDALVFLDCLGGLGGHLTRALRDPAPRHRRSRVTPPA